MSKNEFPSVGDFYTIIDGITISKAGIWWTAALLVETSPMQTEGSDNETETEQKKQRKVLLVRWRKRGKFWQRTKDFALNNPKHFLKFKEAVEKWIQEETWES